MCLRLSQRPSLYQHLTTSPLTVSQRLYQLASCPQRSSLCSPHHSSLSSPSSCPSSSLEPRSCFRRDAGTPTKKRVVFADAKGLALATVRLFIAEPSSPPNRLAKNPSSAKLRAAPSSSGKLHRYKLRLGFPQPVLDFRSFLARLRQAHVQLRSCKITADSLSGKVCVSHAGRKTVHVRLTFDSWWSYQDIPCTFVQQQRCRGLDMDVFVFDASLPPDIDPEDEIEFCVSFRPGPGAALRWDDNMGQNYRVCVEKGD